jgi:FtsZ-binding cell division protein ZapB
MDVERPSGPETIETVEIDYDRLEVTAIMAQVKRIAASAPADPPREETAKTLTVPPAPRPAVPAPSDPPPGRKARLKTKIHRLMSPFFPLIRLGGLPLHEDIQAAVRQIDAANRRLDELAARLQETSERFNRRLDEQAVGFQSRLDALTDRVDFRLVDLDRSIDYIKLLHTLDHNLVVETTKLRIEFEALKSKVRILEKELDAQTQREKALEKRLPS